MMGNFGKWKYTSHIPTIESLDEFGKEYGMSDYGNLVATILETERPGAIEPIEMANRLNYPIELVLSGLKELEDNNLVEIQAEQWRMAKEYYRIFKAEDLQEFARIHRMVADIRLHYSDNRREAYESVGHFCKHKCAADPDPFDVSQCSNVSCPFYLYRFGLESKTLKHLEG